MQTCHRCNEENADPRRFCGACGAILQHPCRSCGFGNRPDDHYCGGCGKKLSAVASAEAEADPKVPQAITQSDQGIDQLFQEIALEQGTEEKEKKYLDQSDLEKLFDDNPESTPKTSEQ